MVIKLEWFNILVEAHRHYNYIYMCVCCVQEWLREEGKTMRDDDGDMLEGLKIVFFQTSSSIRFSRRPRTLHTLRIFNTHTTTVNTYCNEFKSKLIANPNPIPAPRPTPFVIVFFISKWISPAVKWTFGPRNVYEKV